MHPWVGRGQAAAIFELSSPVRQEASRRARGLHAPTPCGATRPVSGGPPYRRWPLGRSRREATPIWMLRSPGPMEVPGGAEGRRDQVRIRGGRHPCRQEAGHGVPLPGCAPKQDPYKAVRAVVGVSGVRRSGLVVLSPCWRGRRISVPGTRRRSAPGSPSARAGAAVSRMAVLPRRPAKGGVAAHLAFGRWTRGPRPRFARRAAAGSSRFA